jgi:hypothetical protein
MSPYISLLAKLGMSNTALLLIELTVIYSEVGFTNWSAIPQAGHEGHADHGAESPAPAFVIVKNATQAAEDALKIKSNSTASPSPSANAPGAAKSNSGASGIYAGMLPIAAAAIGALAIGL